MLETIMKDYKCVFDITGIDDHWAYLKDVMTSIFKREYVYTHNLFANESEKLYKQWNKDFEEANLSYKHYEAYIAAKMNHWLDEVINNRIPADKRIFSWHSDPMDAQIFGVHNDYPDVTIRMHLEER